MRLKKHILYFIGAVLICFLILYINHRQQAITNPVPKTAIWKNVTKLQQVERKEIVIVVVSCGMRQQETLNLIKSAILFALGHHLKFIVITEANLIADFKERLESWLTKAKNKFSYQILPLTFPSENEDEWRNLFKPCAAQRLFLPAILPDIDAVLYLDTDTLFISPVDDIWQFFYAFNSSQIAGLSPEHEDKNVGWYNRFSKHPYYGALGVNSGVMLMNLTRMREFKWNRYMLPLYKKFKLKITWGDQDLINILFSYHPEKLLVFPCEFNYRPDHCMYMSVCKASNGIRIVHGNRAYFHSEREPVFSTIYRIFEEYQFGTDIYQNLLISLELALTSDSVQQSNCGKISSKLLIRFKDVFKDTSTYYESSLF